MQPKTNNIPSINAQVFDQATIEIDDSSSRISYYAFLLLTFFLIGRPQETFTTLQYIRPVLVLTIINVVSVFLQNRNPITILLSHSLGKKYLAFYGMMLIGIPFAYYRKAAFDFAILQYSINVLFFGFFIIHINSYVRMKQLCLIIVSSIFLYSLASLLLGSRVGGRFSFGSMNDPNDLAYLLVSLVPFTILFISETGNITTKILAIVTAGISLFVIFLTGSRGGLIGVIVLLFLSLFTKLSPVNKSIKIIVFICVILFILTNKHMIFTERNATILSLGNDYNVTSEEGRINLWEKGLALALERPLTGIGAQCFPIAIALDRKQRNVQEKWQVVHNSYVQIVSELGIIAFIIFILMLKESFQIFQKARISGVDLADTSDIKRLAGITGIIMISFICHLVVAFFLTQGYSILFTLYFSFAAVFNNHIKSV